MKTKISDQSQGAPVSGPDPACTTESPPIAEPSLDDERRLRDQVCPQCTRDFELCWNDYSNRPQTLFMRGCPSGGIYDVSIHCPHCNYEEEL